MSNGRGLSGAERKVGRGVGEYGGRESKVSKESGKKCKDKEREEQRAKRNERKKESGRSERKEMGRG